MSREGWRAKGVGLRAKDQSECHRRGPFHGKNFICYCALRPREVRTLAYILVLLSEI